MSFLSRRIHSLNVEVVRYRRIKFLSATHKWHRMSPSFTMKWTFSFLWKTYAQQTLNQYIRTDFAFKEPSKWGESISQYINTCWIHTKLCISTKLVVNSKTKITAWKRNLNFWSAVSFDSELGEMAKLIWKFQRKRWKRNVFYFLCKTFFLSILTRFGAFSNDDRKMFKSSNLQQGKKRKACREGQEKKWSLIDQFSKGNSLHRFFSMILSGGRFYKKWFENIIFISWVLTRISVIFLK